MLKLPKEIPAGVPTDTILSRLSADTRPLWERGTHPVAFLDLSVKLAEALRWAAGLGFTTQGLEQISKTLEREENGLALVAEKTGVARASARISRILFMASDGSERFFREGESLLKRYPDRLLGCVVQTAGEDFGEALFGAPKLVRAVLIHDKKAAARVLQSLS
ncbi:MAG: hypothetical protein NDJ90_15830 [Oligoflexia bacterium]|nr:hypothetical protein [Oligoflexia bacterium]